ncbi:methyl jasmonate esterase 1-like [Mercurialis annua]|uniref:methyl jasmonate esterase 1-like n=1 Tax=Mercurialis annua TaxID=3986 RepID=UPI00215F9AD0|nr:methyl jasmonate esterase 1-like [Mercurialis annua]
MLSSSFLSIILFVSAFLVSVFSFPSHIALNKEMESNPQQRHFVLVHGACHGAWCWYKVFTLLKSAGHNVTALDLAAAGVNPKQVDELHSSSDYFEPLFDFMESLPSQERVVLVGHSMAGTGIAMAMERFPQKISAAVFAAATMPGPDLSPSAISAKYAKKFSDSMDNQLFYGNGPDSPPTAVVLGPKYMETKYYRFSPREDLALATFLVRPVPVFRNKQTEIHFTKENYGSVRRIFVVCDEENAEEQIWMVENNPPDEWKIISGSDHMVMFSKTQEFYSYLIEIGQKYF